MAYGIVKNHGGAVRVYSEEGKGTTVRVFLPLVHDSVPSAKVAAPELVRGTGRIMVVDDEEIVRGAAATMLKELGYDVVALADGEEGVLYYSHFGESVDLVLLDMVMPGMDGKACFERIKEIDADVRVLLSTGFGLNESAQHILDLGACGFVEKPYRIDQLSQAVRAALQATVGATARGGAAVGSAG
jgi:DNA-binding NtrC family response regulator